MKARAVSLSHGSSVCPKAQAWWLLKCYCEQSMWFRKGTEVNPVTRIGNKNQRLRGVENPKESHREQSLTLPPGVIGEIRGSLTDLAALKHHLAPRPPGRISKGLSGEEEMPSEPWAVIGVVARGVGQHFPYLSEAKGKGCSENRGCVLGLLPCAHLSSHRRQVERWHGAYARVMGHHAIWQSK